MVGVHKKFVKGLYNYYNLSWLDLALERKMYVNEPVTILDKLNKIINIAGKAILMNLLFLVSCLPIVTIGQAWCALISAVRYDIRGDSWFDGFKKGYKTRFWRGTISWCIMLVIDIYLLLDLHYAVAEEFLVPMIAAIFTFSLAAMVTTSLLMLNVYIPTSIGDWVRNAVNMVFKAPMQLLGAALMFWLPVLLCVFAFNIFYYIALVFIAAYFALAAMGMTVALKEPLLYYLTQARANGTLLAEEGKIYEEEDEEYGEDAES